MTKVAVATIYVRIKYAVDRIKSIGDYNECHFTGQQVQHTPL